MTREGFCLTRWADDFVVVGQHAKEAQRALARRAIAPEELGVMLHPQKTRIVHVSQGFEFLGYKVKQGTGHRLAASKRRGRSNPLNLYAIPREKSVTRFREQIRKLTRRKAPLTMRDMIDQIDTYHTRMGDLLSQGGCATALSSARWMDRSAPVCESRQTMAQYAMAQVSDKPTDRGVGPCTPNASHSWSCPTMIP